MADGRPQPLNEHVRRQLSRMRRRDTKPEMALRRELHRRGLRFRVNQAGLPGTPDISFTRARIAVFVDGCFWHGCPEHFTPPKNNADWWAAKLEVNRRRDRRVDGQLADLGWCSVHIWEHEDPQAAAEQVERLWRARR